MRDNGTVLSEEQLLVAYQRAVDDATMEFVDDEMECHRRGVRAIERAVLEAVRGQEPVGYSQWKSEAISLLARIAELERDNAHANEAVQALREGKPLGPVVGSQMIRDMAVRIAELEREKAGLIAVAKSWEEQRDAARRELAEAREARLDLARARKETP